MCAGRGGEPAVLPKKFQRIPEGTMPRKNPVARVLRRGAYRSIRARNYFEIEKAGIHGTPAL